MLKVAHISDTQIRNFKRHWEYRESYKNLYKSLREKKPDVIVIAGDIAHTKTQISPEFVQLCSEFFKNLADISPLIVIPGNHDGNLKNLTRLDALTPIIDALHHPNIQYYKHSGVYPLPRAFNGNVVVFSCFDENWPTADQIKKSIDPINNQITIGLYHGFVRGAELQNGMIVENCPVTVNDFLNSVDYLMLGDIHKTQIFNRAAYCGSYPQQNFGEDVEKGYLLWTIESKEKFNIEFIQLPNVCPFYTLYLDDDLQIPGRDIQKQARIRVFSRQLTSSEQQGLADKIKVLYDPKELYFKDELNAHRQEITLYKNTTIEDLSDLNIQEKLIRKFLESYNVSDESLSKILTLNNRLDIQVRKEEEILRNVQYKLGRMRWENLFSYGENNTFDFSERKGLIGIFGKNATGKSSLAVDIPLYVLFNTNSKRVIKNDELINEKRDACGAEIDIKIGDTLYKISRVTGTYIKGGKKEGSPIVQGVTEVGFNLMNPDGSMEDKNGETRADTDKEIRKIFGTADDFMSTSMAPQWKLINFIEKGGTERLKLIGRYFDIDIFDKKHSLAKDEFKDIKNGLKLYEEKNLEAEIEQKSQELKKIFEELDLLERTKDELDFGYKRIDGIIEGYQQRIVKVENLSSEQKNAIAFERAQSKFVKKQRDIEDAQEKAKKLRAKIKKCKTKIADINIESLKSELEIHKPKIKGGAKLHGQLGTFSGRLSNLDKKMEELLDYPCVLNPGCCMLEELEKVKAEKKQLETDKKNLLNQIGEESEIINNFIGPLEDKIEMYNENISLLKQDEPALVLLEDKLKSDQELLQSIQVELDTLKTEKEQFAKNQDILKSNKEFQDCIESERKLKTHLGEELEKLNKDILAVSSKKAILEHSLALLESDKKNYATLRTEAETYEYFLMAMSKDGIAREIIGNNIGLINKQIAKIMASAVGFAVELEAADDGKAIEVYFKHERSKPRKIELCSGMEKTLASIAIRAALISVTTLPKSNVYILDEVFSSLDPEYMDAVSGMLEYLKTMFDSVIIITHIDSFKDLVDYVVEIERDEEGLARIV